MKAAKKVKDTSLMSMFPLKDLHGDLAAIYDRIYTLIIFKFQKLLFTNSLASYENLQTPSFFLVF